MKRKTIAFIAENAFDLYQTQMLAGAMKAAHEVGANLVRLPLETNTNPNRLSNQIEIVIDMLEDFKPDGLMFIGWTNDLITRESEFLQLIKDKHSFPMVSIGRQISGIHSLAMDGALNIRELLNHLTAVHSFRNIVFIQPFNPDERYSAYENYMKERDLFNEDYVIKAEELSDTIDWLFKKRAIKAAEIIFDIRKKPVDAIMSMYTPEAFYLLEDFRKRGLQVPDDVAITGWEDGDLGKYSTPSITSVYYPFFEQGYEGVRLVNKLMHGKRAPLSNLVPGKLMVRRTCGCVSGKIKKSILFFSDSEKEHAGTLLSADKEILTDSIKRSVKILDGSKLLDLFISELSSRNEKKDFVLYFEKCIRENNSETEQLYSIQEDLFAFRSIVSPYLMDDTDLLTSACNTWIQCQIIVEENIEISIGFSQAIDKGSGFIMQEINHNIEIFLDMPRLFKIFETGLWKIGVKNCLVALSDDNHSLPGSSRPTYLFRDGINIPTDDPMYQLSKASIIQDLLSGNQNHILVSFILHINFELIGQIIFEIEKPDERVFSLLSSRLCSSIYGSQMLSNLKETNANLNTAQAEIISNLQIIQDKTTALEESNKKLSQLDRLKNDFIANITHDFRSPLMVILNTADLGLRYDKVLSAETINKRYTAIANASIKLKDTIDRLLDLAKMDAQGIRLRIEKIELKRYLENVVDFFRSAAASSSISVDGVFPPHEIDDFYIDTDKLEEILHNILSNAIKFVDPTNGKIIITLIDKEESVLIMVSDNGIGIPHDKLNAIFDRFEQIDSNRGGMYKGTGIGLAFAKQLSGYLGGSLWAESDGPGKGSHFFLEFYKGMHDHFKENEIESTTTHIDESKRKQTCNLIESNLSERMETDEPVFQITEPNNDDEFDLHKGIVVIVDDNQYIREIVREYLVNAGYKNFIMANNGKAGIDAIYHSRPDIVICDYNMPKMRGDELHDQLNSNPDLANIPIVFMTAVTNRDIMLERRNRGAIAYLEKPINQKEFLITIESGIKKYMEYKKLLIQATIDGLTGLSNKQIILKYLTDRLLLRSYRNVSLLFLDIDHFKECNDTYGHQAGDMVLSQIGLIIRESLRSYDRAGRFGGEEFLIVLPETGITEATIVAEKLRSLIAGQIFTHCGKTFSATASFGISSLIDNESHIMAKLEIDNLKNIFEVDNMRDADWSRIDRIKTEISRILVETADKALYQAKYTLCTSCQYQSVTDSHFTGGKCPVCGSEKLDIGRNRVVAFSS